MSIGQDIKHIIGNIFIPPLTDIIYEYAKCNYCNYKKIQNDITCQYCIYVRAKILSFINKVGYINYRFGGISICPKLNKMLMTYSKNGNLTSILLTIDELTYFITHLDIHNANMCCINMDHSNTSNNIAYVVSNLLRFIGVNVIECSKSHELWYRYEIILPKTSFAMVKK